jgi:phenylacetic acid degradation operon negative regulatory protein
MKHRLTFVALEMLDFLEDFLFLASRPNMNRLSRYCGYTEMREAYRAFERWEAEHILEKIEQGQEVLYRLGKAGEEFLERRRPSPELRRRQWDGRWRMVVFDFPEVARKARDAFRAQLRAQRLGCLQKSVWITPDPVIPAWRRLLTETKLTEWVLLFESAELGPVDDVEIASKVWSLDELAKGYERYLAEFKDFPRRLRQARSSELPGPLGQRAHRESRVYLGLLRDDPLLPEALLPKNVPALRADELHREIRQALRACLLRD